MKDQQRLINFLIEIRKSFPHSNFLSSFNISFKLFSLFLLTHDWNIYSQIGISSYLIELTIIPTVNRIKRDLIKSFIMLGYIIICIIPIVLLLIVYTNKQKDIANKDKLIRCASIFIYFIYYLFNQDFYILSISSYFCQARFDNSKGYPLITSINSDCRGIINYITIVLQSIFLIGFICVNYLILIITCDPFFFSNELILNNISTNENQWVIFPFGLLILNLEYHIPFYIITIIKAISRLAFVIYFFVNVIFKSTTFYSWPRFYYLHIMILSMCFVSCIIEYVFLIDWNSNLTLLQSNSNYIISKLIIEVVLAISISYYIRLKDHGYLSLHKYKVKNINEEYALYNKYFYYILNPFADLCVTNRIIRNLQKEYASKPHGKKIEVDEAHFKKKYTHDDIVKQSKDYLFNITFHQGSLIDEYDDLINHFPALYQYLEYFINMKIEKIVANHSKNYIQIIAALFYLAFQKNVNKSFFYIEEFKKSSLYKKSFICRVQVQLINEFILAENQNILKKKSNNFLSFSIEFYQLNSYIQIENKMRRMFIRYIEFIHQASELDIDQYHLVKLMSKFDANLKKKKIQFQKILSAAKCKFGYLSTKLYLYYQFFYQEIPSDVKELFKDITKEKPNFLSIEEYSTIIISYSKSKESLFQIEYASDDFHNCLSYSYGDLNNLNLNDIFITNFAEGYSTYLYNQIQSGSSILVMPSICFKTKHSECKLLFFMGIILFYGNDLHIFAKIAPVDTVPFSKLDAILSNNQKYLDSKKSRLIEKDSCYIIANKSGRIISLSQEFQSFFCLKNKFLKQNKVNIFKDILKEDYHSLDFIKTMLYVIYDNIADIISRQLLDNNRDNYDVDYLQIKKKQESLKNHKANVSLISYFEEDVMKRTGKPDKVFYYVIFKIQILKSNPISLFAFFNKILPKENKGNEKTSKGLKELRIIPQPSLTNDKQDIINKLSLIKSLSLKILHHYYRINKNLIYNEAHQCMEINNKSEKISHTPNNDDNETSDSNRNNDSSTSVDYFKTIQKRKDHKSIFINLMIWIVGLLLYFVFFIIIGQIKEILYDKGLELVYCNLFITVTKKVFISITASILYMQIVSNELQPLVFENGMTNDKNFHAKLMTGRINDFANNYYLFNQHYQSPRTNMRKYKDRADQLFNEWFNVIELGDNLLSVQKPTNLNNILSYLHLKAGQGFHDLLLPLLYNQTTVIDNVKYINYTSDAYKDYDYMYYDRGDLIADKIVVYLIENTFTQIKYRLDEYIKLFETVSLDLHEENNLILLNLDLVNSVIIICLFIYQSVTYFKINQQLFVDYFISYMHIQYFNKLIIEKALILKSVMNITIESSFNKFNNTQIRIKNSKDESQILKVANKIIEEYLPIDIHSFNIEINTNDNSLTPNFDKTIQLAEAFVNKLNSKVLHKKSTFQMAHSISPKEKNDFLRQATRKSRVLDKPKKNSITNASNNNNNITTNSINQTTDILMRPEEHINKNMKILKSKANGIAIVLIIFLHISVIIFAVVYFVLFNTFFATLYTYLEYQSFTLQRIITFHELLIIYQITILKNREIVFVYQPIGILDSTKSIDHSEKINTHYVFKETLATMMELEEQYGKAINVVNNNPYQKTLKLYEDIFNSDDFCKGNNAFLIENKKYLILPQFTSIANISSDYLITACELAGNGFNLKGFKTAMLSLLNSIGNSHSDFINKENRDGEYNLIMMNIPAILIYQMESHRIIDSIFMNYQVSTSRDYDIRHKSLISYEWLFNLILLIYIVSLILIYFIYFSLKFINEYQVIDDIEAVLLSSAMF